MKRQNRDGAKVLGTLPELVQFTAQQIIEKTSAKEAVFVDTRGHVAVAEGTVAGALAIPAISKMASFGAWAFDPQADDRQLILFAENLESAEEMRDHLMRVGIDAVSGYATSLRACRLLPRHAWTRRSWRTSITPCSSTSAAGASSTPEPSRTRSTSPAAAPVGPGRTSDRRQDRHLLPKWPAQLGRCQRLRDAGYDVVELTGSYAGWLPP